MLYASFSKSGGLNTFMCMNNHKLRSTYKLVNNLFVRVRSDIYILTTCCSVLMFGVLCIVCIQTPKSEADLVLFAVPKEKRLNTDTCMDNNKCHYK